MSMLVALILAAFAAIALPVLLVFISMRLWRSQRAGSRWLAIIPIGVLTYLFLQIYLGIYPREEFYRAEWQQHTGFPLPEHITFRAKSATYPDIHGDYSAAAVMEVSPADGQEMERLLNDRSGFTLDSSEQRFGVGREFDGLLNGLRGGPQDVVYKSVGLNLWFRVTFLKKQGIVIFERSSS